MPNLRNKDVSNEDLEIIFNQIEKLEKSFVTEAGIYLKIGSAEKQGALLSLDLFVSAIVNRSIALMRGFLLLAKNDNYLSAVPIIRMQLDNCLRFYASTLVGNLDEFFLKYLKGEHISNILDIKQKKMTDTYLSKELDKIIPGVRELYQNSSAYIHLSNIHSFAHTEIVKDKERAIGFKIGYFDYYSIDKKVDFAFNMYKSSEILLHLVRSWTQEKGNILKIK